MNIERVREDAMSSLMQLGLDPRLNCLDQTVLSAQIITDEYIRRNHMISPDFLRIICVLSLGISIKVNEIAVLALDDICQIFDG